MREKMSRGDHKWAMDIDILHKLPLLVNDTLLADSAKTTNPLLLTVYS